MNTKILRLKLNKFETAWFIISILLLFIIEIIVKDNVLGIIAAITGMINVLLVAKRSMWNYPFGIVNNILYAYIAYISGYGGDFVTMLFYYLPIQFIGIYTWKNHITTIDESAEVESKTMSINQLIILVITLFIGTLITAELLPFITSIFSMPTNAHPYIDGFTTFAGILAGILMIKRYTEQWYIWIAVNIGSVAMWIFMIGKEANAETMVIMWSAYLLNAIYGLYNWRKGN